jgi:hypothetical protein
MGSLLGGGRGNAGYAYAGSKQQIQEVPWWMNAKLNGWHWALTDNE